MIPALIVIDLQEWFFRTSERRARVSGLVEKINELATFFHCNALPVIHIVTVHKADRSSWDQIMKEQNLSVLIEGTEGAMEISALKKTPTDIYVEKTRHSSFIRTNLENVLQKLGVTSLILTGAFVDGCVGLTAIDGFERDFDIVLARDAVMENDTEAAEAMLKFLQSEFQIKSLTSAEIISRGQANKI